jgi:hypothetical protein
MASYSKQMIDIAKEWLGANPDAGSPFLNVPGLDRDARRQPAFTEGEIKRYDKVARLAPQHAPLIAEMYEQQRKVEKAREKLHVTEQEFVDLVNEVPTPGHEKYSADDRYRSDIGRWCLAWARHGYNVFDLSPDFTAAMLLTDARELDIATIRLPFRGILMLIPDSFAKGVEGLSYTKIHVTEIPRADVSMLTIGNQVAKELDKLPEAQRLNMLAELQKPGPQKLVTKPPPDPNDTAIHIYASDGAHVLDTLIERKGLTWDAFDALPDEVTDDADRDARHTLRQIVFGTLAYTIAVTTELQQGVREEAHRGATPKDRPTRFEIGRTIKLDHNLIRAVRGGSREVTFRLKHRHIVRGHYRNQAHGKARALRTMKWISPHWRGPEDGATLIHTYKPETHD